MRRGKTRAGGKESECGKIVVAETSQGALSRGHPDGAVHQPRLIGLPALLSYALRTYRRSSIVRRSARKHCATRPGV